MHKSSSFKGQFFLLTAFAILTALFVLSRYVQPFEIIDISRVILNDEVFIFNNIKEKAIEVVKISKSCEELEFNLEEYKIFAEKFASKHGKLLSFSYQFTSPCESNGIDVPTTVNFNLTLISPSIQINSNFSVPWPS